MTASLPPSDVARALDAYLVQAAQLGGRSAFDALVRRWGSRLLAHGCRLLGDREAARDAAQSAWAEIARDLHRLQDPGAFPAWAYRIMSRRCAREIGGLVHRRRLSAGLKTAQVVSPAWAEADEGGPDIARLRASIRDLSPEQRAALSLHYFEGLSVAETAVALDVPVGTIKNPPHACPAQAEDSIGRRRP